MRSPGGGKFFTHLPVALTFLLLESVSPHVASTFAVHRRNICASNFVVNPASITHKPLQWKIPGPAFVLAHLLPQSVVPPVPVIAKAGRELTVGFLSTDRHWLLVPDWKSLGCEAIRLPDGRSVGKGYSYQGEFWASASNPLWMPDNRHWIRLEAGPRKRIFCIVQERGHRSKGQQIAIGTPPATESFPDLMQSDLLGLIAPDRVLARVHHASTASLYREEPFFSFRVSGGTPNVRSFRVRMPKNTILYSDSPVLSPDGRRLAWLLRPQLSTSSNTNVGELLIACCDSDGTGMHTVGHIRAKTPAPNRITPPAELCWLRDGRHIGFTYCNAVWTVPIALSKGGMGLQS